MWSNDEIDDLMIPTGYAEYQSVAYAEACAIGQKMRDSVNVALAAKDAEIAALRALAQADVETDSKWMSLAAEQNEEIRRLRAELATVTAEYKALWDALIVFLDTQPTEEKAEAIVAQAMRSRFWNEATND